MIVVMPPRMASPSDTVAAKGIFALLFILSIGPVLLIPIPAMVDYPNHLARMFILTRDGTPSAHPLYQVTWALYPNLAMDLIVPRLARFISVEAATRTFYLLAQILVVTGAVAIERVVKGRVHISGFFALMFLYSLPFAWGFVNFEFGLGIALWGIACALILEERSWAVRLAAHAAFIALLFFAHFFTLGIYGATIGLHELWRARFRKMSFTATLKRLLPLGLPALALLGLMVFFGGSVGGQRNEWFFELKPLWLIQIMSGYSLILSALSVSALLGVGYALVKRGALRFERSGAWLLAGFAILFVVIPSRLFDTAFADLRMIVAAALILPAFVSVTLPNRQWRVGAVFCVTMITLVAVAQVLFVWISYDAEYKAVIASFGKMEKRSRVLVGYSGEANDPPIWNLTEYPIFHAPTLAVQYADALVSTLFTAPGKQPVSAQPAYRHLDNRHTSPAPIAILKSVAERGASDAVPFFLRSWQRDFDYLYVVGPRTPNPIPSLLEELAAGSRFVLYRIRKPAESRERR